MDDPNQCCFATNLQPGPFVQKYSFFQRRPNPCLFQYRSPQLPRLPMTIIILHPTDTLYLRPFITSSAGIAARTVVDIVRTGSKKTRSELQIMNYLANFAPSYGKRVR